MSDLGNKEIMARNIKYYMNSRQKTNTEICQTLGFSMSTFSDWIHARTYPRIDKIELMANYFGIEKSDLVEDRSKSSEPLIDITELLVEHYGPAAEGMIMFSELDIEDRAEIKGEMRQMLKATKYQATRMICPISSDDFTDETQEQLKNKYPKTDNGEAG